MHFPLFVDAVARRAELPPDTAAAITRAVLVTVAERVNADEAEEVSAQLPDDLGAYLTGPPAPPPDARPTGRGPAGTFGPVEFVRRVADRADVEPATAEAGVRAVFTTLREAITVGEFQDLVAQLPGRLGSGLEPPSGPAG